MDGPDLEHFFSPSNWHVARRGPRYAQLSRYMAAAIRERLPELRVLLISGDVDGVDLEGPGDEVLDKPFTFDALASAVRRALDRPPPG